MSKWEKLILWLLLPIVSLVYLWLVIYNNVIKAGLRKLGKWFDDMYCTDEYKNK